MQIPLKTPYYLINEQALLRNMEIITHVRNSCGARSLLALKCFAAWSVFGLMRKYLDGTTSSSLYEVRLGHEKFGKETHAYCVGYAPGEIDDCARYADKIIFNSISQYDSYYDRVKHLPVGMRVNPGQSYSHFDLADPARKHSRLGVSRRSELLPAMKHLSGFMFHCNCENDNFDAFSGILDFIGKKYGSLLRDLDWVSLGGGLFFTRPGYPLERFCERLARFSSDFGVQIYLEPGEAAITGAAELVTSVVDIVRNGIDIAIVDASAEAHMLDLLLYSTSATIGGTGKYRYQIAGRSCLAGDIFGTGRFAKRLHIGDTIRIGDAAGYSMVKKNWFNGVAMPSIAVQRLDNSIEIVRSFSYKDFKNALS